MVLRYRPHSDLKKIIGGVAEWLCSGLQSRLRRFDSDPRLQNLACFDCRIGKLVDTRDFKYACTILAFESFRLNYQLVTWIRNSSILCYQHLIHHEVKYSFSKSKIYFNFCQIPSKVNNFIADINWLCTDKANLKTVNFIATRLKWSAGFSLFGLIHFYISKEDF